jgi:hypothetical protein
MDERVLAHFGVAGNAGIELHATQYNRYGI